MIRIGLPPPVLPRLRLHWYGAQTLFARQSRLARSYAIRVTDQYREWYQRIRQILTARISLRLRAGERQRQRLALFASKYEDLVDLLCWAAKDGAHPDRDIQYASLRKWMQGNYRSIRPLLLPYWKTAHTAEDPFVALYAADNVDDFINASSSMETITRTRFALDECREALQTLPAPGE